MQEQKLNNEGQVIGDPLAGTSGSDPSAVRAALVAKAGASDGFNADQWNYFYDSLTGAMTTTDLFLDPNDRGASMTVDSYLAQRTEAGLPIGPLTGGNS